MTLFRDVLQLFLDLCRTSWRTLLYSLPLGEVLEMEAPTLLRDAQGGDAGKFLGLDFSRAVFLKHCFSES